jgi:hypothetical protein
VLAQADDGLSCFFMPRFKPDGSVNALHFQRLKEKLGNRSNASPRLSLIAPMRCASATKARESAPSSRWCN